MKHIFDDKSLLSDYWKKRRKAVEASNFKGRKTMTTKELYDKRKFKTFILQVGEFLEVLKGDKVVTNFPNGGHQVDAGYLLDMQGFTIVICHEDYPEVPIHERPPLVPCEMGWLKNV